MSCNVERYEGEWSCWFLVVCWLLWKRWNERVFQNSISNMADLVAHARGMDRCMTKVNNQLGKMKLGLRTLEQEAELLGMSFGIHVCLGWGNRSVHSLSRLPRSERR